MCGKVIAPPRVATLYLSREDDFSSCWTAAAARPKAETPNAREPEKGVIVFPKSRDYLPIPD